jgi:mycothiol synthase
VASLSNIPFLRGWLTPSAPPQLVYRPAVPAEFAAAAHLLLVRADGAAEPWQITEYIRMAGVSACGLQVAEWGGKLISAVLPISSPGRTVLLFIPATIAGQLQLEATRELVNRTCDLAVRQNIALAQCLLDANGPLEMLSSIGFQQLAVLHYLQGTPPKMPRPAVLPDGFSWYHYGNETHALFAAAIAGSYEQSLDCPALNGMRNMEDTIAGHKAAGQFDPTLWLVVCKADQPAAVLILSPQASGTTIELVYLGLLPAFRGQGLGDVLMRKALALAAGRGVTTLALAVDADNQPALKLYWRHGLRNIGQKIALLRDLRASPHVVHTK